jgi:hypothetical protein
MPPGEVTPLPTRVAVVETPLPANSIPAAAPQLPANSLCGGVLALGGMVTLALAARRKRK